MWAGHTSLFDGLTLTGFTGDGWKASDGVLRPTGKAALATAKPLPAGELIFDWKLPGKGEAKYFGQAGGAGKWNRATVPTAGTAFEWPAAAGLEVRNLFFRETKGK